MSNGSQRAHPREAMKILLMLMLSGLSFAQEDLRRPPLKVTECYTLGAETRCYDRGAVTPAQLVWLYPSEFDPERKPEEAMPKLEDILLAIRALPPRLENLDNSPNSREALKLELLRRLLVNLDQEDGLVRPSSAKRAGDRPPE